MKKVALITLLTLGVPFYAYASKWEMHTSGVYGLSIYSDDELSRMMFKRGDPHITSLPYAVVIDTGEVADCQAGLTPSAPEQPVEIHPLLINGKYVKATALCFDGKEYYQIKTPDGRAFVDSVAKRGDPIQVQQPQRAPLVFSNADGRNFFRHIDDVYGGI